MKRAILCLLLLMQCLMATLAQEPSADTRDYRAVLDIKGRVTDDFYGHEAFDNVILLRKIADYYWRKCW